MILSSPELLKQKLREEAMRLGAHAFGVSAPDFNTSTYERLRAAVARGDLETWGYDETWARIAADPGAQLAQAASVICIALAYAHPAPPMRLGAGRISSYAWSGVDYHHRMRSILSALAEKLRALSGDTASVAICDTRPFAERAAAERAGVGWIGKHTNLIVPGIGSYVFLGELVTSVALAVDVPLKTHCGSCSRCIDACPTGALRGDYTLDVRRCISDLTQRRGMIPREMRPLMGTWIWGCDLCQEICPPTRRGRFAAGEAFAPAAGRYPDLAELLCMDTALFNRRYKASAVGWRGAAVLRRNAAIAIGNTLDRAGVPLLRERLASDPSAMVRGHVAWALGRIGSNSATQALLRALETEKNEAVREELLAALSF